MPGASPSPAAQPTTWAMAASPANSSSIEVSSAYCDNAGAGGSQPAAGAIKSTLTTQEAVRGLCKKFNIPADYKPACAGSDGRACKPPPHLKASVCVYEDALGAGMRVPLHPFYSKLLRHYGLAPSQLTPNAWRYMAAFVVLCSNLGLKPRLSVFRHFFTVGIYKNSERDGWHLFKPHTVSGRCRLFSTTSWQLPKNDGWKERFFFLSSPTATWPCPVKWGKLTREASGDPELSIKAKEDVQKLYNVQGSARIDLMSLLAEDRLAAVLMPAMPVKMEVNFGSMVARMVPTTPMRKSPVDVPSPSTPLGDSITRDQPLFNADDVNGEDWLRTVLKKTADVVIKESSLLRQQIGEARESEAAARAELAEARKSETTANAELDKARKSEAAAKAELAAAKAEICKVRRSEAAAKAEITKAKKSEAAAKAELNKGRMSELAAKAELNKGRKSEVAAKAELAATKAKLKETRKSEMDVKAELITTKAELSEAKKLVVAAKAELSAAKAKVQKTANEYFEDFVRLHNLMMDGFRSAFGTVRNSQSEGPGPDTGHCEPRPHEGDS